VDVLSLGDLDIDKALPRDAEVVDICQTLIK
jgi:hypothetical protein